MNCNSTKFKLNEPWDGFQGREIDFFNIQLEKLTERINELEVWMDSENCSEPPKYNKCILQDQEEAKRIHSWLRHYFRASDNVDVVLDEIYEKVQRFKTTNSMEATRPMSPEISSTETTPQMSPKFLSTESAAPMSPEFSFTETSVLIKPQIPTNVTAVPLNSSNGSVGTLTIIFITLICVLFFFDSRNDCMEEDVSKNGGVKHWRKLVLHLNPEGTLTLFIDLSNARLLYCIVA